MTFAFAGGRDYLVSVRVSPVTFSGDTLSDNDYHQFRFRTYEIAIGGVIWPFGQGCRCIPSHPTA